MSCGYRLLLRGRTALEDEEGRDTVSSIKGWFSGSVKSEGQGLRLSWGSSRDNGKICGLEFLNTRNNKNKTGTKKLKRKEEKTRQQSKSGSISLSEWPCYPGEDALPPQSLCSLILWGNMQPLLQQPWWRKTGMDDRCDYAVMHNN